jgi:isoleucyl-tRNA synthetase
VGRGRGGEGEGLHSKRDIEEYGLAEFVNLCKQRVLRFAAIQTEQSIRLGYWMDWNDPASCALRDKLAEDPNQVITVEGPQGPVTGTVEQIVGRLGLPQLGGSYFTFANENNYLIWAFLKKCWERAGSTRVATSCPGARAAAPASASTRSSPTATPS